MRTTPIFLTLMILASLPATAVDAGEEEIKEKRVVRVVAGPHLEFEAGDDFVFFGDGDDTVRMGAFGFHRGGFIGVQLVDLTPELRAHFGVPDSAGVMVSAVSADGPAFRAGIEVGDIVTAINGEDISSAGELSRAVRGTEEGTVANLEVWRNRKVMNLTATIAERERPQIDVGQFLWHSADNDGHKRLEVLIDDLPENVIRLDEENMSKALTELYTRTQRPEFKARLKMMTEERQGLEERIHELEAKLQALEKKLSKLAD